MRSEWRDGKLGDIADVIMGQSPPGERCNAEGIGEPLLNGPTEFGPSHPTPVQYTTAATRRARLGDVLFCVRGSTTGRMNWADRDYVIGRGLAAIRHKHGSEYQHFLRALIDQNLPDLLAAATGSTFPCVSRDQIAGVPITLPPLREQQAIAGVLGALDDKIAANRRLGATLEALARRVLRAWFVDFDPVVANAAGRRPVGLPPGAAKLFPSAFADSPLGPVPAGWRVGPLGEHITVARGLSYNGRGLADAGLPLHNLNSVLEGGGYKYAGIKWYTGPHADRHLIRPGDLIVANTEQGHDRLLIGYAAIVPADYGETGIYSHHLYRVRVNAGSPLSADFLCYLFNSEGMHDTVSGYGNGTTVNMLPAAGLMQPLFAQPPVAVSSEFAKLAGPFRVRRESLHRQSRTLAALRDALLPRLLSGEVRVRDAEALLGEVH